MAGEINNYHSPEDAGAHKVSVSFVFNPETGEFYADSKDLYSTEPQLHRENVTHVDVDDPDLSDGIDCKGFRRCRFDIVVTGVNITTLKVKLLRWNSKAEVWFPNGSSVSVDDAEGFLASGGKVSLVEDEAFGATIFLKVSEFVGDSFAMTVYYVLC